LVTLKLPQLWRQVWYCRRITNSIGTTLYMRR
jgi:hypothetical protein